MGSRDRCVIDPATAASVVDMPPTIELGEREPLITVDAVGFRERLVDGFSDAYPCHITGFGTHFGSGSIPSLRGKLYLSASVYMFRKPPEPELRPVRHPLRREPLKNSDGTVQMREDLVFPEPAFAVLHYELIHDGAWSVRAKLYDQRPTKGKTEPLFTLEREGADLDAVTGELVPAALIRLADLG